MSLISSPNLSLLSCHLHSPAPLRPRGPQPTHGRGDQHGSGSQGGHERPGLSWKCSHVPALSPMVTASQSSLKSDGTPEGKAASSWPSAEGENQTGSAVPFPPALCLKKARSPGPQNSVISCWGSTVVQARPRAGSCVCSAGWDSRWLCTHWSAAMGRNWLCHLGSGYSCSGSVEEGRNQRGKGKGEMGKGTGQGKGIRHQAVKKHSGR